MKAEKLWVEVCMSPGLYPFYAAPHTVGVVVDVIRASASICTAFEAGVQEIVPLPDLEKIAEYKAQNYITAGERNSYKVEGCDLGNSPYEFMGEHLRGRKIAMTTTNGTQAINVAMHSEATAVEKLAIGCFLNFEALVEWLKAQNRNVLLICSGWKNAVNTEDTLFSGKVVKNLSETGLFVPGSDAALLSQKLYEQAQNDLFAYISDCSPRLRQKLDWLRNDVQYCLSAKKINLVPVYENGKLFVRQS